MIVQTSCTHPNDGTLCEMQAFFMFVIQALISNNSITFYIYTKRRKNNKKIISVSMRADCVFVCDYNRRNHQEAENQWNMYENRNSLLHSRTRAQFLCCSKWLIVQQFGPFFHLRCASHFAFLSPLVESKIHKCMVSNKLYVDIQAMSDFNAVYFFFSHSAI